MKETSIIQNVIALDEQGHSHCISVAHELPLTLKLDNQKIITLMTLAHHPQALAVGYLRNQKIICHFNEIKSITLNWQTKSIEIVTYKGIDSEKPAQDHTIKSSCSLGMMLSVNELPATPLSPIKIKQSFIDTLLKILADYHDRHRKTGGVHECALFQETDILTFIEDVGRHNAVDTIAGLMWLQHWSGDNKIFYTTGRLTAEIVMKVGYMGVPLLLSRSGVTYMGIELAQKMGMTLIASAKDKHFLIFSGKDNIIFDR